MPVESRSFLAVKQMHEVKGVLNTYTSMNPLPYSVNTHTLPHLDQCSWLRPSGQCSRLSHHTRRTWACSVLRHTQRRIPHNSYQAGTRNHPRCSPSGWPGVSCHMDSHTLEWRKEWGSRSGCSAHWATYCTGFSLLFEEWRESNEWAQLDYHHGPAVIA